MLTESVQYFIQNFLHPDKDLKDVLPPPPQTQIGFKISLYLNLCASKSSHQVVH
jgi:hypothetical protein